MQFIDDAEFQVAIDLDQGGRISSLKWREMEFALPFRGEVPTYGWYPMVPWAGRIRNGIIKNQAGKEFQLPITFDPPHAVHGFGFHSSWREIGPGRSLLELPAPYKGGSVEQSFEILDDALRWSMEYESGGCDLPAWLGFHPWFPRELDRGGSAKIEFSALKMMERDSELLPTGKIVEPSRQPWDDAFTEIRGVPAIMWEGAARIDIESDAPWWVVYTEDPEGICIEPQTAPPDAANLGIVGEHYIEALFLFSEE
ncbi:MAG: galactose mutarotase [Actinobacteria bacterium]|nr:galactose mutarotase [Actinomycetota bacterium]